MPNPLKVLAGCPECSWSCKISEDNLGKRAECPKCDGIFTLCELPSIFIGCPKCDWSGSVRKALIGKKGKCPSCSSTFEMKTIYDIETRKHTSAILGYEAEDGKVYSSLSDIEDDDPDFMTTVVDPDKDILG